MVIKPTMKQVSLGGERNMPGSYSGAPAGHHRCKQRIPGIAAGMGVNYIDRLIPDKSGDPEDSLNVKRIDHGEGVHLSHLTQLRHRMRHRPGGENNPMPALDKPLAKIPDMLFYAPPVFSWRCELENR